MHVIASSGDAPQRQDYTRLLDHAGKTALAHAEEKSRADLAEVLVEYADPKYRDVISQAGQNMNWWCVLQTGPSSSTTTTTTPAKVR